MPRLKKTSRRPLKRERLAGLTVTVQRCRRPGYTATVVLRRNGKRLKERYFRTQGEAEALAQVWGIEAGNTGAESAASLSDVEKRFLVEARESLAPYGKSLRDAWTFYLAHLQTQHSSQPIKTAVDALLLHRQKKGKSERYQKDLENRLTCFESDFAGRMIGHISKEEVEGWLEGLSVGAVTRNNYRRVLHVLWAFAVGKRWAASNVISEIEAETVRRERPGILTIGQARALLNASKSNRDSKTGEQKPSILPYVAIALFGGLRDAELRRLDWRDVGILTGYIRISSTVSKTGRERLVPIPENLKAWLQPIAKPRGAVTPPNARKLLEKARMDAEISEWPHDATRHSFGTYEMARTKDIGHVSEVMGNSPEVVQRHYKAAIPFEQGAEFFAIAPSTGPTIVRMETQAA